MRKDRIVLSPRLFFEQGLEIRLGVERLGVELDFMVGSVVFVTVVSKIVVVIAAKVTSLI